MALTKTPIELSSTPGIVDNSNATAITIDASENVLVGQSSTTIPGVENTTAGVSIRGQDGSFFSRILGSGDTNNVVSVNRSTADGNILGFQKDGTTVGSIGVDNNDNFQIGATTSGHGGLYFDNGSISPMAGNSRVQDTLDLGNATYRFKDLYLSGGAYLGGTAAANKLEDYEEGTWAPTLNSGSFSSHVATYTKVGSLVQLTLDATVGTGGGSFVSIPFTSANTAGMAVYTSAQDFATGRTQFNGVIASNNLFFRVTGDNIIYSAQTLTAGATIHASFTYRTDQ
jgi:hypothetical protein